MDLRSKILALTPEQCTLDGVTITPAADDEDLWFATVECELAPGQEDLVNPAGFSIGRAWLHPEGNVPCIIRREDGTRIGYIVLRLWALDENCTSWSYYLDRRHQGQGYGKRAACLAARMLRIAAPEAPIKLSAEETNRKAHDLYVSLGFQLLEEKDGDDLIFSL